MAGNHRSGRKSTQVTVQIPNTIIPTMPKTERWTNDEYARLILLRNKGMAIKDIAQELGRTYNSVASRLKMIKRKFASMRRFPGWSGSEKLVASITSAPMGCRYHANCDSCPFPACIYDGYDPTWEPPKNPKAKHWSVSDINHWNELERIPTPLDDATLANIFRTTEDCIRNFREERETR